MRTPFLLICLLAVATLCAAQASDRLPDAVNMMAYSERPSGMYSLVSIHPVGWSEDGKFAYVGYILSCPVPKG